MKLRRYRNEQLDSFRSLDPRFLSSWIMFFRTCPPALHREGAFLTESEIDTLALSMPPPVQRQPAPGVG